MTANEISFALAPRLNAAGRIDSATAALNLLLTKDLKVAGKLAQKLDNQNRKRQIITQDLVFHAEQLILKDDPDSLILSAYDPKYNPGVVGLVASRLTEKFYRPSIVAHVGEEFTRGSCRSIPEFHITEALDQCADILTHHGGHSSAAGFTVSNHLIQELIMRLKRIADDKMQILGLND